MSKKIHSLQKGKRGEVEFCKWLDTNLPILSYDKKTERNYNQADGHSADVHTEFFLFEVKRCEKLLFDSWWSQVNRAYEHLTEDEQLTMKPVVAFRQNHKRWEFLIDSSYLGICGHFIRLTEDAFIDYAKISFNDYD